MALVLDGIQLQLYSDEEIRKIAVVQVTNPSTYDRGLPKANGVNDPRMGMNDKSLQCPTCGLTSNCNNHYGYVELERPVLRLGHIPSVLCLLRSVCWACSRRKFSINAKDIDFVDVRAAILRTTAGTKDRIRAISEMCKNRYKCPWGDCGAPQPVYSRVNKIFLSRAFRPKEMTLFSCEEEKSYASRRLLPDEILSILTHIPDDDLRLLGYKPETSHPKHYVFKAQLVPPPCIRPASSINSTEARLRGENDLTIAFQDLVRANNDLTYLITSQASTEKIYVAWDKLQIFCAALINSNVKKLLSYDNSVVVHARAISKRKPNVIKNRLTGKKGRLRGNLSGKRVDHAGRTVVGPDSSHDIFELGVPLTIMKTLTFPEQVTAFNMEQLKACICNGANERNGALTIRIPETNGERVHHLSLLSKEDRVQIAQTLRAGWIVERHLRNGDWVLFNRQPSLHKASIMAFRAYETSSSQFKLPLPCTKPFNADFDGDEMNLHALQSYLAIAEAQEIMSVPHQMVTPQSNSVIIALVQDSIVGIFKMSRQDAFCTFEEVIQLAMCIHYATMTEEYTELPHSKQFFVDYASIPPPAILKPALWTGKQVLSWILPKSYNFTKGNPSSLQEESIVIRHGELLCGRLCKQTMGNSSNGIVHGIWKQFSPWAASKFVSDAQRILMQWLRVDSICISIRDCLSTAEEKVDELCAKAMGQADAIEESDVPREIREVRQTQILQEALRSVGAEVLSKMNHNGGIATVVASGSKGNLMNIAQIAGLVGQQTINGSRIAFRSGPKGPRTLACFAPSDNSPEARGFVASSYLQGLQPSEFFFHQQAGREGVVATAVSTADTGYNQRRMVKNQESEVISYDLSVRVSSNLIVQQHYGGDDYDGSRVERVKLHVLNQSDIPADIPKGMKKIYQAAFNALKDIKNSTAMYGAELSAEVSMPCNLEKIIASVQMCSTKGLPCNLEFVLRELLMCILDAHNTPFEQEDSTKNLMFMTNLNRITHDDPGLQARLCVSLQCCTLLKGVWEHEVEDIVSVFRRQYLMGIVNPGEGVGAVGSSCIGEPSTQMTLNIFHYSGIAEKNVTLTGLPRFKQIINAVDTSETSNMRIRMKIAHEGDAAKFYARSFSSRLVKTLLGDIVKKSRVILADDQSLEAKLEAQSCETLGFEPSRFVIIYFIDKNASYTRYLNIEEVGSSLASFMGSSAQVTWSARWCKDWTVRVRPRKPDIEDTEHTVIETLQDSILENACINGIDGVRKAVPMGVDGDWIVETEGSDILEIAQLADVDALRTTTNNIQEVCSILGAEAAIGLMQSELHRVLSFDGSFVDPRHTWLLTDTVARSGSINPLNRHKMEELGGSLLQCASFEQTLEVFEHGAAFGKEDNLGGATEKLIVGQPVHVGTGSFAIIQQEEDIVQPKVSFVAPLHSYMMVEEEVEGISSLKSIMPRHEAHQTQVQSLSSLNKYIPPPELCSLNPALSPMFKCMRTLAHRRIEVIIEAEIVAVEEPSEVSLLEYEDMEQSLEEYQGWTVRPKAYQQFTDVEFIAADQHVITRVEYLEDKILTAHRTKKTHSCLEVLAPDPFDAWKIKASTFSWSEVNTDLLPISIVPEHVSIVQEKCFVKGHWKILLSRTWNGTNIIEAESNQRSMKDCVYSLKVETNNVWDLMEVKGSSDMSMAGGMMSQLLSCLQRIKS